jgi:hypothetical protein
MATGGKISEPNFVCAIGWKGFRNIPSALLARPNFRFMIDLHGTIHDGMDGGAFYRSLGQTVHAHVTGVEQSKHVKHLPIQKCPNELHMTQK